MGVGLIHCSDLKISRRINVLKSCRAINSVNVELKTNFSEICLRDPTEYDPLLLITLASGYISTSNRRIISNTTKNLDVD
jgi:hypothetical protein